MPFLLPSQQRQSTEGSIIYMHYHTEIGLLKFS